MNNVEKVTKEQICEEIFVMVKDEYIGKVEKGDCEISVTLLNGQKFTVTVSEN